MIYLLRLKIPDNTVKNTLFSAALFKSDWNIQAALFKSDWNIQACSVYSIVLQNNLQ